MDSLKKFLLKSVWLIFSTIEKGYWFSWKFVQISSFKKVGKKVIISRYCHFTNLNIEIGNNVYIGPGCHFQAMKSTITIGDNVMFGPNVSIHGGNHRHDVVGRYMIDIGLDEKLPDNDEDVIIGDDCWIGSGAIILKGVRIGEGSIVGAGSVVVADVPSYSIIVGSKVQKVFSRFSKEQIKEHKEILSKAQ